LVVKTEPLDADEMDIVKKKPSSAPKRTIDPMSALPKSRRRETKVPLKYIRDLGDLDHTPRKYNEGQEKTTTPTMASEPAAAAASASEDANVEVR
jgi:hypothetical protein